MKLWVLRHGEAEPRANSDAERRLTAHGREQVLHSAARLLGQPLQAIIASPYVRAQQTAALVHDTLGFAEPVRTALAGLTATARRLAMAPSLGKLVNFGAPAGPV